MRILVYPHELTIGGSQINAIDLAASAMRQGHEVIVYGSNEALVPYVERQGLRFVTAHDRKYRPSPNRVLELFRIAQRERIDLIHAYEWPPCLDAYFGATLLGGVPLVCTVLSMSVMPVVPRSVPLIMGTRKLAEEARAQHKADVWTIEPPINAEQDNPTIEGAGFRRQWTVADDEVLLVTVSRLAIDLKLDALVRAIDATADLALRHPVKLALVGDGAAFDALRMRGEAVNRRLGREVIIFCGAMMDPRSAYAGADVVLGMGSSALRAMAIGRPVVVQGEMAFSALCEPSLEAMFMHQGMYGLADAAAGAQQLVDQLEPLLQDNARRAELGRFGRDFVLRNFDLETLSGRILDIYQTVAKAGVRRSLPDAVRAAALAAKIQLELKSPTRKRQSRMMQNLFLETARSGPWPPQTQPRLLNSR